MINSARQRPRQKRKPKQYENIEIIWRKFYYLERKFRNIENLLKTLSETFISMVSIQQLASIKHKYCSYYDNDVCTIEAWANKDDIPQGIGEPVFRENLEEQEFINHSGTGWLVKPSALYCVMCTASLQDRLDNVESDLEDNPLSGVMQRFMCKDCGNKGRIVVEIRCSKCGRKTLWGWSPL